MITVSTQNKRLSQLLIFKRFFLFLALGSAFYATPIVADDFEYVGLVEGGSGALATLVPVGSPLAGPLSITPTPGGSSTDTDDLTNAKLIMANAMTGNGLFCFYYPEAVPVCAPDEGTPVPITVITAIDLDFNAGGCPSSGTIDLFAFSPSFMLPIPITLDITSGTFLADAGALGTSTGSGDFECNAVFSIISSDEPLAIEGTEVGATNTGVITVSNTGTGPLEILDAALVDALADPFSIVADTCSNTSVTALTGTCDITVQFAPTTTGIYSDSFDLPSNDPTNPSISLNVSSFTTQAILELSTDTLLLPDTLVDGSSSANITVSNAGDANLLITDVSGLSAPFSIASQNCTSMALLPLASCTISVGFAPTSAGDFSDEFSIDSNAPLLLSIGNNQNAINMVSVSGKGAPNTEPNIEVNPDSLSFTTTLIGETASDTITISNNGTAALIIDSLLISPMGPFTTTDDCPGSLAPAESCLATVVFEPVSEGSVSATLTIESDDPIDFLFDVALSGSGEEAEANIVVTPADTVEFGMVLLEEQQIESVLIENDGTAPLEITGISIPTGAFSQTNDCGDLPTTIAASSSCLVTVTFSPTAVAVFSETLTITSDDTDSASTTISLEGEGVVEAIPMITTDNDNLSFGNVTIDSSASEAVTISSTGTAELNVSNVTIDGVDAQEFAIDNNCATLAIDESCIITVTFNPTVANDAIDAVLMITSNDPSNNSVAIPLEATSSSEVVIVVSNSSNNGSGAFGWLEFGFLIGLLVLLRRKAAKQGLIFMAAALALVSPSYADERPVDSYWYIGGGVGNSSGQSAVSTISNNLANAGVTVSSLTIDDSDGGRFGLVGYQATDDLAIEFGYVDLGEADIDIQLGSVTVEELPLISRTLSKNLSLLGSGFKGSVVYKKNITDDFSLLGRLGLMSWEIDSQYSASADGNAITINEVESGTDFTFGLGGEFWVDENFSVRLQWQQYQFADQDADMVSFGVTFRL